MALCWPLSGESGRLRFTLCLDGVVCGAEPLELVVVKAVYCVVDLAAVSVESAGPCAALAVVGPLALAACVAPGACAAFVPVFGECVAACAAFPRHGVSGVVRWLRGRVVRLWLAGGGWSRGL
jgi:hypothetical protein